MKTTLHSRHLALDAKIIDFNGWSLPVEYKKGIRFEHNTVRTNAGLFDVSHMGEISLKGSKASSLLDSLTTNNVSKLKPGLAQYSLITNHKGGILDDIIVYCVEDNHYMICVNAANKDKILTWVLEHNNGSTIEDQTKYYDQIALQGPNSVTLADKVLNLDLTKLRPFMFVNKNKMLIAKTGYTGEDGVEIFAPSDVIVDLWDKFIDLGIEAIGLGARDTLRLEMKYPLYGNEISEDTNPFEAGLGFVVKLNKSFIGQESLNRIKADGVKRKLVGFIQEQGIPRKGYKLFSQDEKQMNQRQIGIVTSGTFSPTLELPIGIGYVDKEFGIVDKIINCEARKSYKKAKIVPTPFVKKKDNNTP